MQRYTERVARGAAAGIHYGVERLRRTGERGSTDLQLRYLDDDLHRIASDAAYEPVGWDAVEVAHFRLVAQCADAAVAETDLLTLRLLRLRASAGSNVATVILSSIRLLTITFETDSTPMTAMFGVSTRGTDKR